MVSVVSVVSVDEWISQGCATSLIRSTRHLFGFVKVSFFCLSSYYCMSVPLQLLNEKKCPVTSRAWASRVTEALKEGRTYKDKGEPMGTGQVARPSTA